MRREKNVLLQGVEQWLNLHNDFNSYRVSTYTQLIMCPFLLPRRFDETIDKDNRPCHICEEHFPRTRGTKKCPCVYYKLDHIENIATKMLEGEIKL